MDPVEIATWSVGGLFLYILGIVFMMVAMVLFRVKFMTTHKKRGSRTHRELLHPDFSEQVIPCFWPVTGPLLLAVGMVRGLSYVSYRIVSYIFS